MFRHLLVFVLLAAASASAQSVAAFDAVTKTVSAVSDEVIQVRHQIHQSPELGNREFKTAELIAAHLRSLGLEVATGVAHTGVIGILKGARPGAVVALRADMDALPITEDTALLFKSTVRTTYGGQDVGVSHACGHDIHVAVMLGVASVLASMRETVAGTVMFIFQPAEEGAPEGEEGGARLMLKEGIFKTLRPDVVFGLHANPDFAVGKIGYTSGPTNATASSFKAILTGKSAHAAMPNLSVDPIVMAAQAVLGIQTIRSRNLSPFDASVITVAQIHGGVRNNIIPTEVRLEGTVRTFSEKIDGDVERRIGEVLDGVARAAGGSYHLDYTREFPVNISDAALVERMVPTLQRTLGAENVQRAGPSMAADDFGLFAREVPGMFLFLGTVKPGTISGGNHTPTFLADDSSIPIGIRVMANLVLDYLRQQRPK